MKIIDNWLNSFSAPVRYLFLLSTLALLAVPDPLPGFDELLLIWLVYKTAKAAIFGGRQAAVVDKGKVAATARIDYHKLLSRALKLAKKVGKQLEKSEVFKEEARQFDKVRTNIKKTGTAYKDIIATLSEPQFDRTATENEIERLKQKKQSASGESEKIEIDKALTLTEQRRDNIMMVIEAKGLAEARIERLFSQLNAIDAQLKRADLVARSSEAAATKAGAGTVDLDRLADDIESLQTFFDEIEQPQIEQTDEKVRKAVRQTLKSEN